MLPRAGAQTAALAGSVRDAAGKPVGGALVTAIGARSPSKLNVAIANADGTFSFSSLREDTYTLSAERNGTHSRSVEGVLMAEGDHKRIDLVLTPQEPMSFSDAPNFTVAGVTDWTAVGGHGSDSILRTSEDLARETVALKTRQPDAKPAMASDAATETRLRAALAENAGSFDANRRLGAFYLQARRISEALPLLEAAYRLNPGDRANERDLAQALEATGDLKQSQEHVQKLLQHDPSAELHRMAGELDEKLGDPLTAVHEYQHAAALDPSEQNYLAWGSELLLHRAVWQATQVFRSGVQAHPQSVPLLTGLGTALFAGAEYEDAARRMCEASDLAPSNKEPYLFMGKIEMAAPSPLPCVEDRLARFVRLRPNDSLANYFYAMALWKRQQLSRDKNAMLQVETLLNKAVTLDQKCSDGYLQLGVLAASHHDDTKAIQLYTKAIDANPQLSEAHYRLGVAYDRAGERDKAQREFQLHDQLQKQQAAAVEQERRDVKQFVVVKGQPSHTTVQ
jgi:tetratricopeptide (TPR) repeat protein